jgi:hypothetical protein
MKIGNKFSSFHLVINTSRETEKQYQLSLGVRAQEIDLDYHHFHIFEYKWNLKLVY